MGGALKDSNRKCFNAGNYYNEGWMEKTTAEVTVRRYPTFFDLAFFGDMHLVTNEFTLVSVGDFKALYNRRKSFNLDTASHADKVVIVKPLGPWGFEGTDMVAALDEGEVFYDAEAGVSIRVCERRYGNWGQTPESVRLAVGTDEDVPCETSNYYQMRSRYNVP